MAIIKCKMCGGDLQFTEGASTAQCEFCGSLQTIPVLDDEKKLIQFERAERLRKQCEFDKAAGIYETIVADFRQEAEAYWGLVLCKYGIEYVDDPATGKKVPTCHRSSFDSIMEDTDFEQALENADTAARRVYREQAKQIEEIRKGIIAVSSNEQPYDIFICYKETDENGERTLDSVLAQDVYDALNDKGYRVFFARITLEDKLGMEYEPYIFAALNSAKIMLAFGTDYEYFNAVWVKNEWRRFLKLMIKDKSKHLIPCFKGIDAYDMPREFAKLQAQDLGKVGAMQDLMRGIEKILPKRTEQPSQMQTSGAAPATASLVERAFIFLEDKNWTSADEYCEKVLDIDPKNAKAYLGKLMAELKVNRQEDLKNLRDSFDGNQNYEKAIRFADEQLRDVLSGYVTYIQQRNENARLERVYLCAKSDIQIAHTEQACLEVAEIFDSIATYKDAAQLAFECRQKAEKFHQQHLLKLEEIRQAEIAKQQEDARKARLRNSIIVSAISVAATILLIIFVIIPGIKYQKGMKLLKQQEYDSAIDAFASIKGFFDSAQKLNESYYQRAMAYMEAGKLDEAAYEFTLLGDYKDSAQMYQECYYHKGISLIPSGNIMETAIAFGKAGHYKDAEIRSFELWKQLTMNETLSTGNGFTVAIFDHGDAIATGNDDFGQCSVFGLSWYNLVAISAGSMHTVGLYADGRVVAVGNNTYGQTSLQDWDLIVSISAGAAHTVGLRADGSVVAAGLNEFGQCNVSEWTDIIAISAGGNFTAGLRADGTVVAIGLNRYGQCDVSEWTDIVAISAGPMHLVGLKSDGTVVAAGDNGNRQCRVSEWSNIVAISAGYQHTLAVTADGKVLAVGDNDSGQCDVSEWSDIVAVSAGDYFSVGLKSDGSVVAVGSDFYSQCKVNLWTSVMRPTRTSIKPVENKE